MLDSLWIAAGCFTLLIALGIVRSAWFRGALGEQRVDSSLKRRLSAQDYRLLKDITLPTRDGTTQIDHLVISRYGVFVIETKNMRGWIFGDVNQSRWTQTIYRKKSRFQNPIRQNYKHVKTVQELLGIGSHQVHSIVAFVGSGVPKTAMPPNVVWDTRALAEYIKSKRHPVIDEADLASLVRRLTDRQLQSNFRTRRAHVKHVKTQLVSRQKDKSKCPRCGAKLVERTNSKSGKLFLACSRFPRCRGTRNL